ncbi:MAG: dTMP kinase [Verrucomicrobiota bacterium]
MKALPNGYFLTLEGIEGTGKTTQSEMLATELQGEGYDVHAVREPGGTSLGEHVRQLTKHFYEGKPPVPMAELLLMGASRAQLMSEVICRELENGKIVICDRFADSTTVYQGYGRKLPIEFIQYMHRVTLNQRWPDRTILLDLPPETGLKRAQDRNNDIEDIFDNQDITFHRTIRQGFLDLAQENSHRIRIVNAERSPAEIKSEIRKIIEHDLNTL